MKSRLRSSLMKHTTSVLAFTLVETVVATAIVAVFIAFLVAAIVQMNSYAYGARLQTTALALAQQKIDEILSSTWTNTSRPTVIAANSTKVESNLSMCNDPLNTQTALSSAYTALDVQVNATRTTVITDIGAAPTRQCSAAVSVVYTYKNKTYTVSLTTLRAIDSI